jgi:hypothetical protein
MRIHREHSMARFDPSSFPDRFAFERLARELRRDEIHRLAERAMASFGAWRHQRTTQFAAGVGDAGPSHR